MHASFSEQQADTPVSRAPRGTSAYIFKHRPNRALLFGCAQTPADRLAQSYAALEQKAELYEKLASGQHDDEEDAYNVDFLRKGTLQDEIAAEQQTWERQRGGGDGGGAGPIDSAAAAVRGEGEVFLCMPAGVLFRGRTCLVSGMRAATAEGGAVLVVMQEA